MSQKYLIPNLANACLVLKLLGQNDLGYTITEIAKKIDLPPTTALRIVSTLTSQGLLRKSQGKIYLGSVLIHLGQRAKAGTDVRDLALPVLKKLSKSTDETSHLALPCDDKSLIVAVCDSPHPLRAASSPGTLTDLYTSSTGKVFLAYLHRDRIQEILLRHPPPQRTANSLTKVDQLEQECVRTVAQGYGIDDEEFSLGVRCLARPVTGPTGEVVAAIGITAAAARFTQERITEMAEKVGEAARELSLLLGHQ